ncbi:unnamed protein product [Chondrus crispus]|uniref:Uncharacterized protein n=1 Tax=Chondrus crispus TaxID=2769 RepID=R7QLW4_CHOCR|nr:unnamed protein product [Chondrus crispus]CDF38466.1 unnamed protein product [Chondrus crispus]|eukprot:XP_005718359.1 unnamed protein product [Chondrus crispus]
MSVLLQTCASRRATPSLCFAAAPIPFSLSRSPSFASNKRFLGFQTSPRSVHLRRSVTHSTTYQTAPLRTPTF